MRSVVVVPGQQARSETTSSMIQPDGPPCTCTFLVGVHQLWLVAATTLLYNTCTFLINNLGSNTKHNPHVSHLIIDQVMIMIV
jgi:hypothetical protein